MAAGVGPSTITNLSGVSSTLRFRILSACPCRLLGLLSGVNGGDVILGSRLRTTRCSAMASSSSLRLDLSSSEYPLGTISAPSRHRPIEHGPARGPWHSQAGHAARLTR